MAAISPALKVGLGLAAAAAAVTLLRGGGADEPLTGETFASPLALIENGATTPTSWNAPPVTRNPFVSGEVSVDGDTFDGVVSEDTTVPDPASPEEDLPATTSTTNASVSTTEASLTLEETVSRRVPVGAPPVDSTPTSTPTSTAANGVTTTTSDSGGIQLGN